MRNCIKKIKAGLHRRDLACATRPSSSMDPELAWAALFFFGMAGAALCGVVQSEGLVSMLEA